jgi:hypothetical protein
LKPAENPRRVFATGIASDGYSFDFFHALGAKYGHCVEAAQLALSLRALARLDQEQSYYIKPLDCLKIAPAGFAQRRSPW